MTSTKQLESQARNGRKNAAEIGKTRPHRRSNFTTEKRVGFYGCWRIDRVVRVGEKEERRYPILNSICIKDCPCGVHHEVRVFWRKLKKHERELEPDVLV